MNTSLMLLMTVLLAGIFDHVAAHRYYTYSIVFEVNAHIDTVFARIAQPTVDSALFGTAGLIKKINSSRITKGTWPAQGAERQIEFANGAVIRQTVLRSEPNQQLSYEISGFKGWMKTLTERGTEQWTFVQTDTNKTWIEWTFNFEAKHFLTGLVLRGFVRHDIRPMMQQSEQYIRRAFDHHKP